MIDIKPLKENKNNLNEKAQGLRKYKGFQGTVKSLQLENTSTVSGVHSSMLCMASCGLDRFLRIHHVETGQLILKIFLKSRSNCLLFSKHEPVSTKKNADGKKGLEDDQISEINSEDLGTDDLWSDMETIMDEHPVLKNSKRKAVERLKDFDSNSDSENDNDNEILLDEADKAFLKPR